jgi:hypothetical protein
MKASSLVSLVVAAAFVPSTAFADDKADCLDAVSKGQRFRDVHKLVEAREQFRVCAAVRCPAVIKTDCANWFTEVEKALPTVVLAAKNQAGADVVHVKVTVDGQPLVSQLDGEAVPLNVGPHNFDFEQVVGAERFTRRVVAIVKEGQKNQLVSAVLVLVDPDGLMAWTPAPEPAPVPVPQPVPVRKVVPSVVLTAKNPEGVNVANLRVSVDGGPLVSKLDAREVPLSAGPHRFYFEGADGTGLDTEVVVREGERNQPVSVVLKPPIPSSVTPTSVTASSAAVGAPIPWKTVDWIVGGAGVAALGVGAWSGTVAILHKNAADCSNNVCAHGAVSGIRSAALISDVGWITGAVLLGTALVGVAVEARNQSNTSVGLAPLVTTSGGEVLMRGIW